MVRSGQERQVPQTVVRWLDGRLPVPAKHGTIPAVRTLSAFIVVMFLDAGLANGQSPSLPLQAGDRVSIRAGSDALWSEPFPVDAEGRFFIPRVGAVALRPVPATATPAVVRTALATIYRSADATVIPLRRVTVGGEAKVSGVYFVPPETTLRDAVAMAQGAGEMGTVDRITLLRGGARTVLRDWIATMEGSQLVASGDVLIIDRESWLKRNALTVISTAALIVTSLVAVTR